MLQRVFTKRATGFEAIDGMAFPFPARADWNRFFGCRTTCLNDVPQSRTQLLFPPRDGMLHGNKHRAKPFFAPPRNPPMNTLPPSIERHRGAIETACREAGVKALWLFGSATGTNFQPDKSDVDFLVELSPGRSPAIQFFQLYRTLAELFDERIDLVSIAGVRNRFFEAELDRTRIRLYAAA